MIVVTQFFQLNRSFVRGEIHLAPYYEGMIYDETLLLTEGLLRVHDFGFLTFSSQPAALEEPELLNHGLFVCDEEDLRCIPSEHWYTVRQRPYVDFCIPQRRGVTADATCPGASRISFSGMKKSTP